MMNTSENTIIMMKKAQAGRMATADVSEKNRNCRNYKNY